MSTILQMAAADYMARGLSVIALSGKTPNGTLHRHGIESALSGSVDGPEDWAILAQYFDHPATTGIGILTGGPYFVVDIDGEEGAQAWQAIAGDDYLSDRWVAKTGRGLHLWFADVKPRATRKLGEKLDLKGVGGYVAAPPSRHPDGHLYAWLTDYQSGPPMEAPAALIALLDKQDRDTQRRLASRAASKRVRIAPQKGYWFPSWGFEGVLKAVREAPEGKRNAVLYWAAFTLAEDDATEDDYDSLHQAALDNHLTERETRLTIRSARRAFGG